MSNWVDSRNNDVRAKAALVKAFMNYKTSLIYEINLLKIQKTYHQSNVDYRDSREMLTHTKNLLKKFHEFKAVCKSIKNAGARHIDHGKLVEFCKITPKTSLKFEHSDIISVELEKAHEKSILQIEEYQNLKKILTEKEKNFEKNQEKIDQNLKKKEICEGMEEEIFDYRAEIKSFNAEIGRMLQIKDKIQLAKREGMECVKIYQQLSEGALKLRSKLLLRADLYNILSNANTELENLSEKIAKSTETYNLLEEEHIWEVQNSSILNSQLYENRKKIKKLEITIEGMHRELEPYADIDLDASLKLSLNTSLGEGDTICIPHMNAGFTKLKEEKDMLVHENIRLKEKISKLSQGKK